MRSARVSFLIHTCSNEWLKIVQSIFHELLCLFHRYWEFYLQHLHFTSRSVFWEVFFFVLNEIRQLSNLNQSFPRRFFKANRFFCSGSRMTFSSVRSFIISEILFAFLIGQTIFFTVSINSCSYVWLPFRSSILFTFIFVGKRQYLWNKEFSASSGSGGGYLAKFNRARLRLKSNHLPFYIPFWQKRHGIVLCTFHWKKVPFSHTYLLSFSCSA